MKNTDKKTKAVQWEYRLIYTARRTVVKNNKKKVVPLKSLPEWAKEKKWKGKKLDEMLALAKKTAIAKHTDLAEKGVA